MRVPALGPCKSTISISMFGTPRLARPRKDTNGTNGRTNRFGFRSPTALSNKVADSQNNINSTKANLRLDGLVSQHPAEEGAKQTSQLPLPRSHLPRLQQFPVRLATPANYHPRTASAEKSAKTAANHHTARRSRSENGGSSASSVNDADSGVGSQKSGGEAEIIEQLECSPSARNRLRASHKSRPMEMIFPNGHEKKFELRDLRDSIEVTEIMSLELPPLPLAKRLPVSGGLVRERARAYNRQISRDSGSSEDDEGIEDGPGEEKVHRDRVLSEKDEKGVLGAGEEGAEGEGEDLWGHGEAMVGEEDMPCSQDLDSDQGKLSVVCDSATNGDLGVAWALLLTSLKYMSTFQYLLSSLRKIESWTWVGVRGSAGSNPVCDLAFFISTLYCMDSRLFCLIRSSHTPVAHEDRQNKA
ncbi:hypothetical protein J6590_065481 [Homalodisca vitripennis]|nr:hypothetical protein J6590_065481 [Homalodisca vitripennis]